MAGWRGVGRQTVQKLGLDVRRFRRLADDPFFAMQILLRDRPCRLIFDVGAFQGDVAAKFAEFFPSAAIYSFEPFPASFEKLKRRFHGHPRLHVVNAAVSSQSGEARFHVNESAATNSLLSRPESGRRYFPQQGAACEAISVTTITLDEFRRQHNLAPPDILKMDIQGNELSALRGAEAILQEGATDAIYTEIMFVPHYEGGVLFHELSDYLATRRYSLFGIYHLTWAENGQLRFGDALFVSERLRSTVIDRQPEEP